MTKSRRKFEWFLILSIPQSSNCKKPIRGFSKILIHNIFYEFTSFSIFWPNKNPQKKYNKFQRHSLLTVSVLHKKNLHMETTYFFVLVFGHRYHFIITSPIICPLSQNFPFFGATQVYIHAHCPAHPCTRRILYA